MSPEDLRRFRAEGLDHVAPTVQLNLNLRGMGLSATLEINERSARDWP